MNVLPNHTYVPLSRSILAQYVDDDATNLSLPTTHAACTKSICEVITNEEFCNPNTPNTDRTDADNLLMNDSLTAYQGPVVHFPPVLPLLVPEAQAVNFLSV